MQRAKKLLKNNSKRKSLFSAWHDIMVINTVQTHPRIDRYMDEAATKHRDRRPPSTYTEVNSRQTKPKRWKSKLQSLQSHKSWQRGRQSWRFEQLLHRRKFKRLPRIWKDGQPQQWLLKKGQIKSHEIPSDWLNIRRFDNNNHWWECESKGTLIHCCGNRNCHNHFRKQFGIILVKLIYPFLIIQYSHF